MVNVANASGMLYNSAMEIKATVSRIRVRKDDGWSVIDFVDGTNLKFVGVGIMPAAYEGEKLELVGDWTMHKTYGMRFSVSSYSSLAPESSEAALRFLSSGLIKGVGLSMATAIVAKFGDDTLEIIEKEPQKLELVSGIGKVKSKMIHESYMEKLALRDIYMGLQELGFSINQAAKIHKLYGDSCVQMIKDNPYRLISDVENIGFKTADKIARNAGFEFDSPFRIKAGVIYVLGEARNDGNTCLPYDTVLSRSVEVLGAEIASCERIIEEMVISGDIVQKHINGDEFLFLPGLFYKESDCAVRLLNLMNSAELLPMIDLEGTIESLERKLGVELAEKQKNAVIGAFEEGVLVITGGPGTGKTTILRFIIEIMESMELKLELAAPTGRAAKRISDTTGREARTIHRLLEFGGFGTDEFSRDESFPIEADVIILDEMSMVDIPLFHSFLKAVAPGTRLIMVGDFDQLPPVGPGNVLKDVILSETVPVVRLTEIYRQAGRSMIVLNSFRINRGQMPGIDANEDDFRFIRRTEIDPAREEVIRLCTELAANGETDVQVLAPMKQNALGVYELNACLQQALNPPSPEKSERKYGDTVFRTGDRVMQIRNNYKLVWKRLRFGMPEEEGAGVFNGDIGTVMEVNNARQSVKILFDDERLAEYSIPELEEVELAYAISIHKSQGSEFSTVVLPLVYGPPMLMNRNILYTAVTRARERVVIIGSAKCVERMVNNTYSNKRYSALEHYLRELCGTEVEPNADSKELIELDP